MTTNQPTWQPSIMTTNHHDNQPTWHHPSWQPTIMTANHLDNQPSWQPYIMTINQHDNQPSWQQTNMTSIHHDNQPSWQPSILTTNYHDHQPSWQTTIMTTNHHDNHPSWQPTIKRWFLNVCFSSFTFKRCFVDLKILTPNLGWGNNLRSKISEKPHQTKRYNFNSRMDCFFQSHFYTDRMFYPVIQYAMFVSY